MFSAWNGVFTKGQLQDIQNMSKIAHKLGKPLHDLLDVNPPTHKNQINVPTDNNKKDEGFIKKPVGVCPKCGGVLKVFSLNRKESAEHPGMMSKWECCKTCKSSGCGYIEYSTKNVEQIISEVKNGSSK